MANPVLSVSSPSLTLRQWWQEVDRTMVYLFTALILIGIVLCAAAGPIAAMRKGIDNPLHFVERQFIFLIPTLIIMGMVSCLNLVQARRVGVIVCGSTLLLMVLTLLMGPEIKGSQRWLLIGGFSLQPSEFFKPGFVMAAAWFLAEGVKDKSFPGGLMSLILYGIGTTILILQPDYGQLFLLTAIWGVMFFIAGWSWSWIFGLGAVSCGVLSFGYQFVPHVRNRIDRFLSPETGDTYQVDMALQAISAGGGAGHLLNDTPGVKNSLPDAHTDFVFAVAAEEFGFLLGVIILGIFAAIAFKAFQHAFRERSLFIRVAIAGLSAQLAFQAIINIGVNLAVLPAKGMTLPFISYGGSSLLATGLTAGLLLALTRERPVIK